LSCQVWMAYPASCASRVRKLIFYVSGGFKTKCFCQLAPLLDAPRKTLCASSSRHRWHLPCRAKSMRPRLRYWETTSFHILSANTPMASWRRELQIDKNMVQLEGHHKVGRLQLNIKSTLDLISGNILPQFHTNAHGVHVKFRSNFI